MKHLVYPVVPADHGDKISADAKRIRQIYDNIAEIGASVVGEHVITAYPGNQPITYIVARLAVDAAEVNGSEASVANSFQSIVVIPE